MKRTLLYFIATVMLFTFAQGTLFGQDLKPFEIKSPFKKSTYDGTMIKKMKKKQIKEIILASKDADAIKYYNSSRSMATVGTTLIILGDIGLLGNLLMTIGDANTVKSGSVNTKSNGSLGVASAAVILVGAIFLIPANSYFKKSINSYNKAVTIGTGSLHQFNTPYRATGQLFTVTLRF